MPERLSDLDPQVHETLRDLMQNDYPLLLQTFLLDVDKRLRQLHDSLDRNDWEGFRQAAHSFKGSCGSMGAPALQQACHGAELAGVNADAAAAREACDLLDRLCLRIRPLLSVAV